MAQFEMAMTDEKADRRAVLYHPGTRARICTLGLVAAVSLLRVMAANGQSLVWAGAHNTVTRDALSDAFAKGW